MRRIDVYPLASQRQIIINTYKGASLQLQPYVLGDISLQELEQAWLERHTQLATVHSPEHRAFKPVHGESFNSLACVTYHDALHQLTKAAQDPSLKILQDNLINFIRTVTDYHWSAYLWYLFDAISLYSKIDFFVALFVRQNEASVIFTEIIDEFFLTLIFYFDNQDTWSAILGPKRFESLLHGTEPKTFRFMKFVRSQLSNPPSTLFTTRGLSIEQRVLAIKQVWQSFINGLPVLALQVRSIEDLSLIVTFTPKHHPGQNLKFLKITKQMIEKYPMLSPYLNQIQLVEMLPNGE
jgi:hypothetical protein